jgi:hypothetical protein
MTKTTTRAFRPVLAAALLAGVGGGFAGAGAQTVHRMALDVDGGEEVISRQIYGHFAEHLRRGIYDGIWRQDASGEYRIRDDVVEALRARSRTCAGPAAASPTTTSGRTAWARARIGRPSSTCCGAA